jgi:molybdopterin-guanine dinucleotide biosynthesis protein A
VALVTVFEGYRFEIALVLGVDFPFVRGALLDALAQRLEAHDAVAPAPGAVLQPLVAAYSGSAVAPLIAACSRGERSLSRALAALDVLRVEGDTLAALDPDGGAAFNLNTPGDLREAERRVRMERAA